MSAYTAVEAFLTRLRDGWQAPNELAGLERSELDRIAGDFGMSANDLETLVERGPDAAHLLYERLHALGMSSAPLSALCRISKKLVLSAMKRASARRI